jgi:hypothetical protein
MSWLLIRKFKPAYFRFSAFVLLNVLAWITDFFSLSRGYGLSIALMLSALWGLKKFIEYKDNKSLFLTISVLAGSLSVLANFTLANFFLPLACICLIWISFYQLKNKRAIITAFRLLILLIFSVPIMMYAIHFLFKLKNGHELYFGGSSGLLKDTVLSQIKGMLYKIPVQGNIAIITWVIVSVLLCIIIISYTIQNIKSQHCWGFSVSLLLIILLAGSGSILGHYIFDNPYLYERTALFLVPLFLILIVNSLDFLNKTGKFFRLIPPFTALIFIILFIYDYNPKYNIIWHDEGKFVLEDIGNVQGNKPSVIYTDWYSLPVLKFYAHLHHEYGIKAVRTGGEKDCYTDGFFYSSSWGNPDAAKKCGFKILKNYPVSKGILMRKK